MNVIWSGCDGVQLVSVYAAAWVDQNTHRVYLKQVGVYSVKHKKKARMKKSNLRCFSGITPRRVTSGGVHLRGLAPGQHSSDETAQGWRVVGDAVSDLTDPKNARIELRETCLATELTDQCVLKQII